MSTATAALRAAIHDALTADGALAGILGGPKIYDEPPANAAFPYVTLGEARVSDFSAGDESLQLPRGACFPSRRHLQDGLGRAGGGG